MPETKMRLGELLVEAQVLTEAVLQDALALQRESGKRLGTVLIQQGFVTEPQLVQALSRQMSIPWVSLWHLDISEQLLEMIPEEIVIENGVLPIYVRSLKGGEKALYVAMDNPSDTDLLDRISGLCGLKVKPMIAGPSEIANAVLSYYGTPWRGAPFPSTERRVSSVPPPPAPRSAEQAAGPEAGKPPEAKAEEESILLDEVVDEEESAPPEGEMIVLTEPVQEAPEEAPAPPAASETDMFAPPERETRKKGRRRKGQFKRGALSLTFLDGTSISVDKEKEQERARQSASALEARIDALDLTGGGEHDAATVLKGVLKTLMRRGLLTDGEIEDLIKGR